MKIRKAALMLAWIVLGEILWHGNLSPAAPFHRPLDGGFQQIQGIISNQFASQIQVKKPERGPMNKCVLISC